MTQVRTCPASRRPAGVHAAQLASYGGLETVDTLIMAGIADDCADAIRLALARFREQPEYEQLREQVREIDRLRAER